MGATETELRLAWERVAGRSRAARRLFEQIAERHRQPHRRYHDLRHVVWVIRHVYELAADEPVTDLGAVVAAACYHDAVYMGRPGHDERASADLARRELPELFDTSGTAITQSDESTRWTDERVGRVAQLILATAHLDEANEADEANDTDHATSRSPTTRTENPATAGLDTDDAAGLAQDAAVLLDADLAVLGAPPGAYLEYVRRVRAEHSGLNDDEWRQGRSAVLRTLLDRPRLYRTPTGNARWEARARANLTAELAGLDPPDQTDEPS